MLNFNQGAGNSCYLGSFNYYYHSPVSEDAEGTLTVSALSVRL